MLDRHIGEVHARDQLLEHRLVGLDEAELRQITDRIGHQLEPHAEQRKLGGEPRFRKVAARTHVDDRANIELAARDHGNADLVLDHEIAAIERERAGGALCDEAAAQPLRLLGLEACGFGYYLDLVAMGRSGDPASDLGDLR